MSRRRQFLSAPRQDERMSIGDTHVESAIQALNKTCGATVATMTSYDVSFNDTLRMLFPDDTLERMAAVKGLVDTRSVRASYEVVDGVVLSMDFEDSRAHVPTISPAALKLQHGRIDPLLNYIANIQAIHNRFEEVKAVLRWLNRNATPGAVRYFFPAALKLCPSSPALAELQHVPSRYTTPPKIGDWSQAIKDAATTVVSSLLLPADAVPATVKVMWLTFPKRSVHVSGESSYSTDQMTYYI